MDLLSHPFRLGSRGHAVTAPQGSDESNANQLVVMMRTLRGERPLVPLYGLDDPTFVGISHDDLIAQIELFGPDVEVISVEEMYLSSTSVRVEVTYE